MVLELDIAGEYITCLQCGNVEYPVPPVVEEPADSDTALTMTALAEQWLRRDYSRDSVMTASRM